MSEKQIEVDLPELGKLTIAVIDTGEEAVNVRFADFSADVDVSVAHLTKLVSVAINRPIERVGFGQVLCRNFTF